MAWLISETAVGSLVFFPFINKVGSNASVGIKIKKVMTWKKIFSSLNNEVSYFNLICRGENERES